MNENPVMDDRGWASIIERVAERLAALPGLASAADVPTQPATRRLVTGTLVAALQVTPTAFLHLGLEPGQGPIDAAVELSHRVLRLTIHELEQAIAPRWRYATPWRAFLAAGLELSLLERQDVYVALPGPCGLRQLVARPHGRDVEVFEVHVVGGRVSETRIATWPGASPLGPDAVLARLRAFGHLEPPHIEERKQS